MNRRPITSWLFVAALFVLVGTLGVLQYQWIGKVSEAARDRLRNSLQANLEQLSLDFNSEIANTCRQLVPAWSPDLETAQREIERRYEQFRTRPQGHQILKAVGIAVPHQDGLELQVLNWDTGQFESRDWPEEWEGAERRIEARMEGRGFLGPPELDRPPRRNSDELIAETPVSFQPPRLERRETRGRDGFPRREFGWMIFALNLPQIRNVLLPDAIQRRLESGGVMDYEVKVVSRADPSSVIFLSDPAAVDVQQKADASIGLLDLRLLEGGGRGGRGGRGRGALNPAALADSGRWVMFVRHRAGSLEAVVAQTRWRNLAVTGGVLLLLVATLGALVRFTRNAQRLAQLQMDFVAGVSHELRTPLTALYTAGYNLRGRVAQQPAQVERYGEMIQREAGRLKDLVEQVLRFASANAGRVIQEPAPVAIGRVVEDSIEASRAILQSTHCSVETHIAPDLPPVMGDPQALQHAVQNLLANAAKYGAGEAHWIGVTASGVNGSGQPAVEIRVADRGPGIPADEQKRIFDAFYRGRRTSQEQVHGAGLGLNLVKKIVEAHGGTVRVESEPEKGAEFIVRIPAAPAEAHS